MPRTLKHCAAVATLAVTLAGCESYYYSKASRASTRDAYLRYLARYPEGRRAAEARRRVDRLRYREARRADRPLGYHRYLQQHPDGAFASAARTRLAQLALARARTAADLELVVERSPGTAEARAALERLPGLLAREALATGDPAPSQRFIDRFPASRDAPRVRAHLAAIRFKSLRGTVPALEAFIDEFSGTRTAREAEARLEALRARGVRESLDEAELARFRGRFPRSGHLAELERLVAAARRRRAIIALDVERLTGFPDRDARALVRLCRRSVRRCARLREQARRAAPWRPREDLSRLRAQAFAADPRTGWEAVARLAWMVDLAAGDLLLELLGSERLSTVWAARRALAGWAARQAPPRLRRWIETRLARLERKRGDGDSRRATNPDEDQRRAYLGLMGGKSVEAERVLHGLRGARALTSAFLLLSWERQRSPGAPLPRPALTRLTAAARARMRWLRDAFPAELHRESAFAATLAERELFALDRALEGVLRGARGSGLAGLQDLRREAAGLLRGWQVALERLAAEKPGAERQAKPFRYERARWPDVDGEVRRHEQGRGGALSQLRGEGATGSIVAAALCRASHQPACGPRPVGL
jgi:hypothetical protein